MQNLILCGFLNTREQKEIQGKSVAFNTAYGMVSGAFISFAGIALTVAQIKPIMDMVKPILEAVPEISEGKQMITQLSGNIELDNVSFRYNENMPLVIDDLSLKIRPGQYVAIVGATGCGKSTILRLMLGFESPQKGAVYVDGKDIEVVDLKSLRRNIGVVMQNGKLFTGDGFRGQRWNFGRAAAAADDCPCHRPKTKSADV